MGFRRTTASTIIGTVTGVVCLVAATPTTRAREPGQDVPVFGAGVGVVPVAVRVVDRDGRPVTDLTQADFTITEDGTPQDVRLFSVQQFEGDMAASTAAEAFPGEPVRGRIFLIALGRGRLQPPAKGVDGLLGFVREMLLPTDQVAVIAYGRATDFTTDHASVAALLERFKALHEKIEAGMYMAALGLRGYYGNPAIVPEQVAADIETVFGGPAASRTVIPGELDDAERMERETRAAAEEVLGTDTAQLMDDATAPNADVTLPVDDVLPPDGAEQMTAFNEFATAHAQAMNNVSLLYSAVEHLRRIEGEKHLIFVTETGFRLPNAEGERSLALRAADARVAIHYIHTGGMGGGGFPPASRFDGPTARTLAEITGGQFYGNRLRHAIDDLERIDAATRVQYVLGYYPSRPWDGEFRRIEVRVNRRGLTLYHRGGYFARDALPENWLTPLAWSRMAAAVGYPRPVTDLPITVRASMPSGRRAREVTIDVTIDPNAIRFVPGVGGHVASLEFAAFIVDGQRKVGEVSQTLHLTFTDARLAEVSTTGWSYQVQVPVEAGARIAKVIVYDPAGDRLGSNEASVERVRSGD